MRFINWFKRWRFWFCHLNKPDYQIILQKWVKFGNFGLRETQLNMLFRITFHPWDYLPHQIFIRKLTDFVLANLTNEKFGVNMTNDIIWNLARDAIQQSLQWIIKAYQKRDQWPITQQIGANMEYVSYFGYPDEKSCCREEITFNAQLQKLLYS